MGEAMDAVARLLATPSEDSADGEVGGSGGADRGLDAGGGGAMRRTSAHAGAGSASFNRVAPGNV